MNASDLLGLIVLLPILVSVALYFFGWNGATQKMEVVSVLAIGVASVVIYLDSRHGKLLQFHNLLSGDALTAILLGLTCVVSTMAILASREYLERHPGDQTKLVQSNKGYAMAMQIFIAAMTLAVVSDNLGLTWVGIEATTISTAFLVAHKATTKASEAAWKYVIICSFGITIAFFGTVILYFSAINSGMSPANALVIHDLVKNASHMRNNATTLGLGLLLIGYATKVGLFPFHTWLADAHSQAPAPVSALMSGVLLSVAGGVLLRISEISRLSIGHKVFSDVLMTMGVATIVIAAMLLVRQKDYKRLYAYSSLENMGLIAVGIAVGSKIAIYGLIIQIVGHGISKGIVFITTGHIYDELGDTSIDSLRSLSHRSPILATFAIIGTVGILGFPPFLLFGGETSIAFGLIRSHDIIALIIVAGALLIAAISIYRHGIAMLFGPVGPGQDARPFSIKTRATLMLFGASLLSLLLGIDGPNVTTIARAGANAIGVNL